MQNIQQLQQQGQQPILLQVGGQPGGAPQLMGGMVGMPQGIPQGQQVVVMPGGFGNGMMGLQQMAFAGAQPQQMQQGQPQQYQLVDLGNGQQGIMVTGGPQIQMTGMQPQQQVQVQQAQQQPNDAQKAQQQAQGQPQFQAQGQPQFQAQGQPQFVFAQAPQGQPMFQVMMPQGMTAQQAAAVQQQQQQQQVAAAAAARRPAGAPFQAPAGAQGLPGGQQYVIVEMPNGAAPPNMVPQQLWGGQPGAAVMQPQLAMMSQMQQYPQLVQFAGMPNRRATPGAPGAQQPTGPATQPMPPQNQKRPPTKAPQSIPAPTRTDIITALPTPPNSNAANNKSATLNPMAMPFMPGSKPGEGAPPGAPGAQATTPSIPDHEQRLAQAVRQYLRLHCGGGSVPLSVLQAEMEALHKEACQSVTSRWTEFCLHNSVKVFSYTDTEIEAHKLALLFESSPLEQRVTLVENANYIDADRTMVSTMAKSQGDLFKAAQALLAAPENTPTSFWNGIVKAAQEKFAEGHVPSDRSIKTVFRNMHKHNSTTEGGAASFVLPEYPRPQTPPPAPVITQPVTSPTQQATVPLPGAQPALTQEALLLAQQQQQPQQQQQTRISPMLRAAEPVSQEDEDNGRDLAGLVAALVGE